MTQTLPNLNLVLRALSDPTRRDILERLNQQSATVTELAASYPMALPTFLGHLKILEKSGLIRTFKKGRIRTCSIQPLGFKQAEQWIGAQRAVWEERRSKLSQYLQSA